MSLKSVAALTALAVGGAVLPPSAHAFCSTGALQVCASFDAHAYASSGHYYLELKVWNLYDAGNSATGQSNVITWAGIGGNWTGTASLMSATWGPLNTPVPWSFVTNINSNPVGTQINFAASGDNGINNGLIGCYETPQNSQLPTCAGTPLILTFETSSLFTVDASTVYGWHSQAINGTQCSGWFATNGETTSTVATADCGGTVTPEPITMTLLATGLAGLGGVGFVRRRKGFDVENA